MTHRRVGLALLAIAAVAGSPLLAEEGFVLDRAPGAATISRGGQKVATYVWQDDKILRPYLAHVYAPGELPVTRRHPPLAGHDATDHDTMHPGMWLAFGDLNGSDFWRNKGTVESEAGDLAADRDAVRMSFELRYRAGDVLIARESRRIELRSSSAGYLFTIDSTFTAGEGAPLVFGDQEEMGLGVRLATPLTVKGGRGVITNSEGRKNEKEVWGRATDWCDYSAVIDGRRAGLLLMPHPGNFRKSWMHVRDYGLMVANPFGQSAFMGGEKSHLTVKPGEKLRLRFAVLAHATDRFDADAAYKAYVEQFGP